MLTTIDLDPDALLATKEIARAEGVSLGKVVSRLVRQALTRAETAGTGSTASAMATGSEASASASTPTTTATGFVPFAPRGVVVSNELIDKLRDSEGL